MSRAKGDKARQVSGWCGMPLRAVMQHRGCPLEIGKGGYSEWSCECECHDEGYVEPVNAVVESTPGYMIPRGEQPTRSLTRTNTDKGVTTYSSGTKVGTHWTTGVTGGVRSVGATAWVEVPLEEKLKNRVALTSKRSKS